MKIYEPTMEAMNQASILIKDGGIVVMPTETVYGLACNALNVAAVKRVFEIKQRPADNPLILHIAEPTDLRVYSEFVPEVAYRLAERFWPGPLTMVLPKRAVVPYEATGGLDTVALRIPRHFVSLTLIRLSGCAIAAPSANLFTQLSPTSVEDINHQIIDSVDMVLDGGPCQVGLESTVLDLTTEPFQVLRPGQVSRADIQAVLGQPLGSSPSEVIRKSPGLYRRHYAPRAQIIFVDKLRSGMPGLTFSVAENEDQIHMPLDPAAYASVLYGSLKKLDDRGHEQIGIELPPFSPEWEAIHDRLKKASSTL